MKDAKTKKPARRIESFGEAIIVFGIAIALIIICSIKGLGTAFSLFSGAAFLLLYTAVILHWDIDFLLQSWYDKLHGSLAPIMIIILCGFNAVSWILSGTMQYLMIIGMDILKPSIFYVAVFLLMYITSMVSGQTWAMLPTIGVACMGIAHGLGVSLPLTMGAIACGGYLADEWSPLSDTFVALCASSGVEPMRLTKAMTPIGVIAVVASAVLYTVAGFVVPSSSTSQMAQEMSARIAATGDYTVICLLPVLVLIPLIAWKLPTAVCILGSSVVAIIIAVATNGFGILEAFSNCWFGYAANTGDAMVDSMMTGGGSMATASTVFVIFAATCLASTTVLAGIPGAILNKFSALCNSSRSLILTTLFSSLVMLFAVGTVYGSPAIVASVFGDKYKEKNLHPLVMARTVSFANSTVACFIPWSVISSATVSFVGYEGSYFSYLPYEFGMFISIALVIVFALLNKGMIAWQGSPEELAERAAAEAN